MKADQPPSPVVGETLMDLLHLHSYAERTLGGRAWWLLSSYGRLMSGPNSGQYVSGIAAIEARQIVDALATGETVPIHLMHRHRSGCYESSSLAFVNGSLVMRFPDREELA